MEIQWPLRFKVGDPVVVNHVRDRHVCQVINTLLGLVVVNQHNRVNLRRSLSDYPRGWFVKVVQYKLSLIVGFAKRNGFNVAPKLVL